MTWEKWVLGKKHKNIKYFKWNNFKFTLFDSRGNHYNYENHGITGGKVYKGQIRWTGHGFLISGKYDNGDNTWIGMSSYRKVKWCFVYQGTNFELVKDILIIKFQKGDG